MDIFKFLVVETLYQTYVEILTVSATCLIYLRVNLSKVLLGMVEYCANYYLFLMRTVISRGE